MINNAHILHVIYPLFLSDFEETLILSTDISKIFIYMKFRENLSHESGVVPCGQTDGCSHRQTEGQQKDKETDMTKSVTPFHNFSKSPKYVSSDAA